MDERACFKFYFLNGYFPSVFNIQFIINKRRNDVKQITEYWWFSSDVSRRLIALKVSSNSFVFVLFHFVMYSVCTFEPHEQ